MSDVKLDFSGLSVALLSQVSSLAPAWVPGGRMDGQYYVSSSIEGGPGNSFKINFKTGEWGDFANLDEYRGTDLISLYAKIYSLTQGQAAKELAKQIGYQLNPHQNVPVSVIPPKTAGSPKMVHSRHGHPSMYWTYTNHQGDPLFYIARYDVEGSKQIVPWTWNSKEGKFVPRAYPDPRPLYNLHLLEKRPDAPVLLVEGEKSADAVLKIAGGVYVPVTFSGGSQAWRKTDFSSIYGRKVLIWPDADDAGISCMYGIAKQFHPKFSEIKIIDTKDRPDKWDAADALNEGWTFKEFAAWAKPRISVYEPELMPEVLPAIEDKMVAAPAKKFSTMQLWSRASLANHGNREGNPIMNAENCRKIIAADPALQSRFWFDTFYDQIMTWTNDGKSVRGWEDIDNTKLLHYFQGPLEFHKISITSVVSAVETYASENSRSEPLDWLLSLKWDGIPRIDEFFVRAFGTESSEYTIAASKNFWISMVARIASPGCKVDAMIVLEGAQGTFKSTALQIIGGRWYAQASARPGDKDFILNMRGRLLMEIAELSSFRKVDQNVIKQTLSASEDVYRAPYERLPHRRLRTCVLAGTTNEDTYLDDPTGARRFWPIRIGIIDIPYIKEFREQCFAEAFHRYQQGELWHDVPIDQAAKQQEERQHFDEWHNAMAEYLEKYKKFFVTLRQIAKGALDLELDKLGDREQKRMTKTLQRLNWISKLRKRNGVPVRGWVHRESVNADFLPDVSPQSPLPYYPNSGL